jgi:hypothetical protein
VTKKTTVKKSSPTSKGNSAGVESITFKGWRNSYRIFNHDLEAVVVPKVGRLLSLRLNTEHGKNVLNLVEANAGTSPPATLKDYTFFGGLYTWLAPQDHWVDLEKNEVYNKKPDPTIDRGPYEVTGTGAGELTMISPTVKAYGLKVEKIFTLPKNENHLEYMVRLHNVGHYPVRWAVWNLTAVKPNGIVFFDIPHGEADFNFFGASQTHRKWFSNIMHIIDDTTAAVDYRKYAGPGAKMFVRVGSKFVAYRQPGSWFVRRFPNDSRQIFTDQQSQIELWADAKKGIFELEAASPDYAILPGKSVSWTETMSIVPDEEKLSDDPFREVGKLSKLISHG